MTSLRCLRVCAVADMLTAGHWVNVEVANNVDALIKLEMTL